MYPQFPTRKIDNIQIPAIGWGAMGLSAFYFLVAAPDEERLKLTDAVYEQGCTFWDTADMYGDSEDLLGAWFERTGKRSEISWPQSLVSAEGPPTAPSMALPNILVRV